MGAAWYQHKGKHDANGVWQEPRLAQPFRRQCLAVCDRPKSVRRGMENVLTLCNTVGKRRLANATRRTAPSSKPDARAENYFSGAGTT